MCCIQNAQRLHHNKNRSCTSRCGFHMAFIRLLNISTGAGALSIWFVTIRKSIWETQRVSRRIAVHDSHSIINSCPYSSVKRITKSQHTHLVFFFSLSLSPSTNLHRSLTSCIHKGGHTRQPHNVQGLQKASFQSCPNFSSPSFGSPM